MTAKPWQLILAVFAGNLMAVLVFLVGTQVFAVGSGPDTGPRVFPYRGFLELDGVPLDETVDFTVTLSNGSENVAEAHDDVQVYAGEFQLLVGSTTELPSWVWDTDDVTVSIAVNGTQLSNPQAIRPVPYAYWAGQSRDLVVTGQNNLGTTSALRVTRDGASGSMLIDDDAITTTTTPLYINYHNGQPVRVHGNLSVRPPNSESVNFTALTSGFVGLGGSISNPLAPLHFAARIGAGFDSYSDYQLLLYDSGNAANSYGLGIESGGMTFNTDDEFRFYRDNALVFEIASFGLHNPNGSLTLGDDIIINESLTLVNGSITDSNGPVVVNDSMQINSGISASGGLVSFDDPIFVDGSVIINPPGQLLASGPGPLIVGDPLEVFAGTDSNGTSTNGALRIHHAGAPSTMMVIDDDEIDTIGLAMLVNTNTQQPVVVGGDFRVTSGAHDFNTGNGTGSLPVGIGGLDAAWTQCPNGGVVQGVRFRNDQDQTVIDLRCSNP